MALRRITRLDPWLMLAALLGCGADVRVDPFGDAQLVFVAPADGVEQLWLANAETGARRQLTLDGRCKALPTWSPDGERLVFVEFDAPASCSRRDTLVVFDDAGRRALAELEDVLQIAFDADGRSVLVVSDGCSDPGYFASRSRLSRVDVESGEVETIASFADRAVVDAGPIPGQLAVSVGHWEIHSSNVDEWTYEFPDVFVGSASGELARIVDAYAYDTEVDWHPSGERIVFQSDRDSDGGVYSVAADGSDLRRESTNEPPVYEFDPQWSPDGRTLLSWRMGWGRVPDATVLRGDDGVRELVDIRARDWSPDQTMLLVDSEQALGESERVIVLELDGETQIDLGEGHDAAWRP